ncbi:hypothetical protein HPP92_005536 [Vanilla planifolia]|uniref:SPRY domain-containing protein n=1 Tax=Vanilla planifolia TaxID=51239 RepID=A0A835VDA3_VANPL|nr:hypothetical protein HPP92_005536 [Vanilla planifolia]
MTSKEPLRPSGGEGEPAAKRPKIDYPDPNRSASDSCRVKLNPADCALDFNIEDNGLQGSALHEQGFAYCWSGARANVGIRAGKYCFGCKIVSEQVVDMVDTPPDQQHLSRVGISRGDDSVGSLGETFHSFGFGGTGKFSCAGKFSEYGEKFGVGDVIVCAVDLDKKPLATVGFSRNGKWLGIAKEFNASSNGLGIINTPVKALPWESALFPHVLLKNVVIQVQFSMKDGLAPEEGYKPWSSAIEDGNAIFGPTFSRMEECEVLMMVGLPASGKTTWAEKWLKEHTEKRYLLLGTNLALDQMKVPGLLRKRNYGERFDLLMDRATGIFNTLLARAANTPRNYILDQTNVYKSARNRKLKSFLKFRKVAVVVFPMPEELKFRAARRFEEMGKEVPADAVNEMLANFVLPLTRNMPGSTELFDEVIFSELNREEAQWHLVEMKHVLALSSNLKDRSELSPHSRQSSVHSFSRPLVANQEFSPAFEGYRHVPQPNISYSDFSGSIRASPLYSSPALLAEHPPREGYTNQSHRINSSSSRLPFSIHSGETGYRNYEGTSNIHQRYEFDRIQSFDMTPVSSQKCEIGRDELYQQGMYIDCNTPGRNSSGFGATSSYGYSPSSTSYGGHYDPWNQSPYAYDAGSPFVAEPSGASPRPSGIARGGRPPVVYSPPSWHRR